MFIPLSLLLVGLVISKVGEVNASSISSFECGFEEITSARLTFSLKFFLVVLVFLVFDVEIALLLPLPIRSSFDLVYWSTSSGIILLVLIVGLYLEMVQGRLR